MPALKYDKARRTITAPDGSVEQKWITALSDIRRFRRAMRNAVEVLREGHDAETAIGILETELETLPLT